MRLRLVTAALTSIVLVAACAQEPGDGAEVPTTSSTTSTLAPPSTSTTTSPTTTTSSTTTTTSTTTTSSSTTTTLATGSTVPLADATVLLTEDVPFTSELSLDVFAPALPGEYPTVVMFHGGGWVGGAPDDIAPLATSLAAAGTVVFNAPYRLALRGGGYPLTFEDAACAVRFARHHAPRFGGNPDSIVVVGYSAGAHIGSITALTGDSFVGDCAVEEGSSLPTGFVGVAGPYDTDVLDPFLLVFFGTERAEDPEPWIDGNPYTHLGENPDLVVRLIQGKFDLLVPAGIAVAFYEAFAEAGYDVALTIVEEGTHRSVVDPDLDGDLVVAAVLEAAGQE